MHHTENNNHSNHHAGITSRLDKIRHLGQISNRESLCYHESGHTVMNMLLHGGHQYQIQHRFGGFAISDFTEIRNADLEPKEIIGVILAGFAAQKLQKTDIHDENYGEKMLDYSLENKFTPVLLQPDTLIALHILRKEYKKATGNKITTHEQEKYLREGVNKIANFFSETPKLLRLLKLLSRVNGKKPILDRGSIDKCIEKAGITGEDVVIFSNKFRNSGILDFTAFASPQSSAE